MHKDIFYVAFDKQKTAINGNIWDETGIVSKHISSINNQKYMYQGFKNYWWKRRWCNCIKEENWTFIKTDANKTMHYTVFSIKMWITSYSKAVLLPQLWN